MVSYTTQVEVQPACLIMRARGTLTTAVDRKLDSEVAEACKLHKRSRVLIDISRMKGVPTTLEDYQTASTLGERWANHVERAAILDSPEYAAESHFFETVAVNRGYVLKAFTREDEALQWLLGDLAIAVSAKLRDTGDTLDTVEGLSGPRWVPRWF